MSGGAFDYDQYRINVVQQVIDIVDKIERYIGINGREKTKEEIEREYGRYSDWLNEYPEDRFYYKYPDEVIEKFKEGIELLKKAQIYAQRIDWLLSGDDGEESFLQRLEEDLKQNNS